MIEEPREPKLEYWVLNIANLPKFYNPFHRIIRVEFKGGYYDIKCEPGWEVPNPKNHLALAILPEGYFDSNNPIPDERLNLLPGQQDKIGTLASLPKGLVFLISSRQRLSTSNPQNASAGFSISNTNMFDLDNVTVAITAPLQDRDYTTLDNGNLGDPNNLGIGLFINKQGTVVLKSSGASITLGKEGIHIGGRLATESSSIDTGVLSDNTIADMVPSTMFTAAVAIPKLPNLGQIAAIANASMKFIEITDKAARITELIG